MNATTAASARMNSARYSRFDARSWYSKKRKSGRGEALTTHVPPGPAHCEVYVVPLTVAMTLKYSAPAPEGMERPPAVYACCVCPACTEVVFPRALGDVPQTTCVSDTPSPAGPRIRHEIPNTELVDTDVG